MRIKFVATVLVLCAFSIGGTHWAKAQEGEVLIIDFITGAFKDWGQSKFLSLIGLGGGGATSADIGAISEQISKLTTLVEQEQQQIIQLEGEFANLISKVDQNDLRQNLQLMQKEVLSIDQLWTGFANDIGSETTFEGINKNPQVLSKLRGIPSDISMCKLSNASQLISDNGKVGYFSASLDGYNNVLADSLDQLSKSNNIAQIFENLNNAQQIFLFDVVSALQMAYSIQSTYLYLSYYNDDFKNLTFCIDGVAKSGNSYSQSLASLNKYYTDSVQGVVDKVISNLVSDNNDALTIERPSTVNPREAKNFTWQNASNESETIIKGSWQSGCELYVWEGVSNTPFTKGVYDSTTLTARCDNIVTSIDYQQQCSDYSAGISVYTGTDNTGKQDAILQCPQYALEVYCPAKTGTGNCMNYAADPYSPGAETSALSPTPWFSTADAHADYYFDPSGMQAFPESPSMTAIGLSDFEHHHNTDGLYVETAKMVFPDSATGPQGTFGAGLQFNAKSGRNTVIFVTGSMKQHGFHYHWDVRLTCAQGDEFCAVTSDESGLCITGEELKLTTKNSNTAYIKYTGEQC